MRRRLLGSLRVGKVQTAQSGLVAASRQLDAGELLAPRVLTRQTSETLRILIGFRSLPHDARIALDSIDFSVLRDHPVGPLAAKLLGLLSLLLQCLLPEAEPAILHYCVYVDASLASLLAALLVILLHLARKQQLLRVVFGGSRLRVLVETCALSNAEFGTLVIQLPK